MCCSQEISEGTLCLRVICFCLRGVQIGVEAKKYRETQLRCRIIILIITQMLQNQTAIEDLYQSIENNQATTLRGLDAMIDLYRSLAETSQLLYEGGETYPIQIYRAFRRTFEVTSSISQTFTQYEPNCQQFEIEKKGILEEHSHYMNTIISFQNMVEPDYHPTPAMRKADDHESIERITYLQKEVLALNHLLQTNNEDFQEQIQNYNHHLYELKQTVEDYEGQILKAQQLEVVLDELENKIVILREQKQRDQMIIDSMARKIRFFQKQRGGREAFYSPRNTPTSVVSPSAKGLALARSNMASYKRDL